MNNRETISTRTLGLAFLAVVVLLSGGAGFSVLSTGRAAERIDKLVTASLERERLIGLVRLDAALLIQAADVHINATSDDERVRANDAMDVILGEIQDTSTRFSLGLPATEAELWRHLADSAERLVRKVSETIRVSNRKEAERARKHLEEEAKPISFELDDVAGRLAHQNAQDTRALLAKIQEVRIRTGVVGGGVVALALVISIVIALQVTRMLRRQGNTISEQMTELNRRNEELDAFASRVAHDLVAPLSPLKGYLTLARRQVSDASVKEILTQAESSTARMSELVEGLLRFCRAGKSTDRAAGEMDTAVTTILLEQAQAAAMAKVRLERNLTSGLVVKCPPQLLQSIAQNVIGNAVKYTAGCRDAQVWVSVSRVKGEALFEVKDNGPGISVDSAKKIFQPFFRAPETRGIPGTGLGLATTKRLVEGHGGTIDLNTAPGGGTTIQIRIPLVDELGPRVDTSARPAAS
jgi:signal transduction histidine kinase